MSNAVKQVMGDGPCELPARVLARRLRRRQVTAASGLDDDGLPIGIQIVGPRWSEMRLLDIARELEHMGILPGFQAPPGY